MKTKFIIFGAAVVATASLGFFQPAIAAEKEKTATEKSEGGKSSVSAADKKFAENAAKGGMMEVAWGKAAASKGQNNDVKQFGSRMVKDHSKAGDELKGIASKKGITLPSEEPSANFKTDKTYMDMMVKDHEKDLAEFQKEAKNGGDPDLKKFADKTSKMISSHLSEARRINNNLKHESSNLTR
jgi:putative membrane protein